MKKSILALALITAGTAAMPAFAQNGPSADSGHWFVGGSVGRTNGSNSGGFGSHASGFNFLKGEKGRRTGYGVVGGYRWQIGEKIGVGAEAGYADLGNFRVKNVFNSKSVNQRSTVNALRGWMAGANGRVNLVPQWYISARGGYFRANDNNYYNKLGQDAGLKSGGRPGRGGWYAGVGTGWDISEQVGVGVQYDYFHANAGKIKNMTTGQVGRGFKRSTGIVSVNAEYRF
jgi:OOP family OmpA-OmpF porin/outer membrane immunogenic protein